MGSVIHQPSRVGPLSAAAASVAMQAPEQLFHPLILPFAHFEIVRRVQVQQGERFDGRLGIEGVALDHFIKGSSRFKGTV